ncbi:MAG: hypothetical protein HC915_01700 [Anaerolineae bacterium]|nr:hypothetical protein [Anaerolineae bacterium]
MKAQWHLQHAHGSPELPDWAVDFNLHTLTARLMIQRGLNDAQQVAGFLYPERYSPALPELLPGLDEGARLIIETVSEGTSILLWGDHDVDGICTTLVLEEALRQIGAVPVVHIAAYRGVSGALLQQLVQQHSPGLVIACDTGAYSHAAAQALSKSKIPYLVLDHSGLPEAPLKDAVMINPNLLSPAHPLATLAGVGIAFKVVQQLYHQLGGERQLARWLELVALGTLAERVPLLGESRYLVQQGLRQLTDTARPGLVALARAAAVELATLGAEDVRLSLAPRLNAFARLGDAQNAHALLTADASQAAMLATRGRRV